MFKRLSYVCVIVINLVHSSWAIGGERPFVIEVVDRETKRGVPLVELRTVNEIRYFTDSNGLAAIDEPGLWGRKVYFNIKSHGYQFQADGFGYRGAVFELKPGGRERVEIERINIAERLYRVTGQGIYRDTILAGETAPIKEPLINGDVFGSDSVVNVVYRGKIRWFWGDTNRPSYPLGSFHVSGATSLSPRDGGLDPDRGIDLTYFVDSAGFAKKMAEMPGDGPTWIFGLTTIKDESGKERMFAHYMKVRNGLEMYRHGLAEYDDASDSFRDVALLETKNKVEPFYPGGQTLNLAEGGVEYVYHASPFPLTRVRARVEDLKDLARYESYTCLKPGSRIGAEEIERDSSGRAVFGWKANTPPLGMADESRLVKAGRLKADETLLALRDPETGETTIAHGGSVYWNEYRGRYIMILGRIYGEASLLGEIRFAEADRPLGPWVYSKKIITHDKYSFYNPKQHPYFDRNGGREIYLEGTYTRTFSGAEDPTPRYDYNQVMYKLNLADPRLDLPVAVYRIAGEGSQGERFSTLRGSVRRDGRGLDGRRIAAFFASERSGAGTIPVYAATASGEGLTLEKPTPRAEPVFFAIDPAAAKPPAATVPLKRFVSPDGERTVHAVDSASVPAGYHEEKTPFVRVWPNPIRVAIP